MNLKLGGVQKVLNALANVESELKTEIGAEIQSSANKISKDAKRNAPSNFGQLRNSIGTNKEGQLRYAIFATAFHAPFIEFGTRAKTTVPKELQDVAADVKNRKKRGNWKTFVDDIYTWGIKKKIIKKGDRNHAYNIAKKIWKEGISPKPYLYPAFVAERGKLIRIIREIVRRKR